MIFYTPTKFHFNIMNSFRVMGRGHFPLHRAQATQPGPDRVDKSLCKLSANPAPQRCM